MSYSLTDPQNIQQREAPYWHSRQSVQDVSRMTGLALLPIVVVACLLFGVGNLINILTAGIAAMLCEFGIQTLTRRSIQLRTGHSLILAVILTLTLPPACPMTVVIAGTVVMILAKEVFGGLGRYLWHPVLIARVLLVVAFPGTFNTSHASILKKDHLLWGDMKLSEPISNNSTWFELTGQAELQSWSGDRPIKILNEIYRPATNHQRPAAENLLVLIRDRMPPQIDCFLGTTFGHLGETCVLAILVGGLFLIYRGYVESALVAGALVGAGLSAALWPLPDPTTSDGLQHWPFLLTSGQPSLPVGLVMVIYHLVVGEFMLAIFFIASDMTSSPLRTIGQACFGLGIGFLTIWLRSKGYSSGAAYWAILMMNTLVPFIDRATRRRVYGT